jgi:2-polyprenyl-3-methyl-5-hydroxy-6-metoxy-1,4-benzoquinol methylase
VARAWRRGKLCGQAPGRPRHGYGRRVPDAIFAHPRLALVYDAFDGARDDLAAYLGIARELRVSRVVDIGCGTGSLAVLLAGNGCTEPAPEPPSRPACPTR